MHIRHFGGLVEISDEAGVRAALSTRFDAGFNEFECFHGELYPLLTVWVNGELACAAYWTDPDSMEASRGDGVVPSEGATEIRMGSPNNIDGRWNGYVISAESAVIAVLEFMRTRRLPETIRWVQL